MIVNKKRNISSKTAYKNFKCHQSDHIFKIEGQTFNFDVELTDLILHFLRTKCKIMESRPETAQLTNISAKTLNEFLEKIIIPHFDVQLFGARLMVQLWDAAKVLQIPILVETCETLVGQMVDFDTFDAIYKRARRYRSYGVLCNVRRYLLGMFEGYDRSVLISTLTYEDMFFVVKNDNLFVKDEELVLQFIFEWAEHFEMQARSEESGPCDIEDLSLGNEEAGPSSLEELSLGSEGVHTQLFNKKNKLSKPKLTKFASLLRVSRYGLASLEYLQELSKHHLCERDKEAKLVITEAINYKLDRDTHGYWPPFAIQRVCQNRDFKHIGVIAEGNKVRLLKLEKHSWQKLRRCPLHAIITNLIIFDDKLYVINRTDHESLIFVYKRKKWKFVIDLPNTNFIAVAKGNCIYAIDGTSRSVKCVSPRETPVLHSEIKFPDMSRNPESALDFDKSILIFCSTDSVERSTVISLEVPEHKWTDCGYLDGSATNLVGFRKERNYFILQRDGSLSQVLRNEEDNKISITFIRRLWSIQNSLRGAFIYRDHLILFGNAPMESSCLRGVLGLFWKIEYWYQTEETSNFVHMFMHRDDVSWDIWA
ncbi:hypothetical protein BgiMline_027297 [Biomphalaria glabrata]|nr:hypothetical protein BgiMline_025099 [Biomphalaria glabrata]